MADEVVRKVGEIQVLLGRHDERIGALESTCGKTEKSLEGINKELRSLREDYANRPTWVVSILITIMTTLVGTMVVYIVTHMKGG